MAALRIVLLVVLLAVLYGIAHDLVTAHLCVEYFSIGHPRVIESADPLPLALVWGLLATWWMGAGGGLLLALAARAGRAPKRRAGDLLRPLLLCLGIMGAGAALAGLLGRILAAQGAIRLVGATARLVPADRHAAYLGNLWAHNASYLLGAVLLVGLAVRTRWRRKRAARQEHGRGGPAASLTP